MRERVEALGTGAVAANSEPEGDAWVFTRHKTNKYNNIKVDLGNYLENQKVKDVRKYFARGLIDSSQIMLAQLAYLCSRRGKQKVIRFVEGTSTLTDFKPRFSYGVFKELGD